MSVECKIELGTKKFTRDELREEYRVNPAIAKAVTESTSILNTVNERTKIPLQTLKDTTEQLSKRFGIEVVYENNPESNKAGSYNNGYITLNEAVLESNPDTAWHEFAHPIIDTVEQLNPSLFKALSEEAELLRRSKLSKKLFNSLLDRKYWDGNKLNSLGKKEAMVIAIGHMAKEMHNNPGKYPKRENVLRRVMTFFTNIVARILGRDLSLDISTLNPDMTLTDMAYLLGRTDTPIRLYIEDGPIQYKTLDSSEMNAYLADGYSKEQVDILKKINEKQALVGEPVEVKVEDLPEATRKLFEGEGTVMRYSKVGGGIFYGRVSDVNKKRMKMTVEERATQENDPRSIVARETGTEFHAMGESILEALKEKLPFNYETDLKLSKPNYIAQKMKLVRNTAAYQDLIFKITSGKTKIKHQLKKKWTKRGEEPDREPDFEPDFEGDFEVGMTDEAQFFDPFDHIPTDLSSKTMENEDDVLVNGRTVLDRIVMTMLEVYYDAHKMQYNIDPTGKPLLLMEKTLLDEEKDMVGTPDIVILFSNGSAGVLDNKFISLDMVRKEIPNPTPQQKKLIIEKRKLQGLTPEYTKPDMVGKDNWYYDIEDNEQNRSKLSLKTASYERQIEIYSNMLRDKYGVKKVTMARIIPFAVKYDAKFDPKTNKMTFNKDTKVQFIMTGLDQSRLLGMIPIKRELTGNEQLDFYIQTLADNLEVMEKNISSKKLWDDPESTDRYYKLKNTIKGLQLGTSYDFIVDNLEQLNKRIEDALPIVDPNNPDYLNLEEIDLLLKETRLYDNIVKYLAEPISLLAKDGNESQKLIAQALQTNIAHQSTNLIFLKSKLENMLIERLREYVLDNKLMSNELFDSYKNQTDLSAAANWFVHIKSINHPLVQVLTKTMDQVDFDVVTKHNKLKKELGKITEELTKWGASKGLYGNDIYKDILRETKNDDIKLITMYDKSLYDDARERRKVDSKANTKWFIDTFHRSTIVDGTGKSEEERFQEEKKRIESYYKKTYKDEKVFEKKMNEWLNNNDIYYNDGDNKAWYNNYIRNSYSPKQPEKHYSKEYAKLLLPENKPLLEFYEFYIKELQNIGSTTGIKIDRFFVPAVHRDTLEKLSDMDISGTLKTSSINRIKSSLIEAWKGDPNRDRIQTIKRNSDEREVPLIFNDPYMSGKDKSKDLARSLFLFSVAATEYKGLKKAEVIAKTIRNEAAKTPFVVKNKDGIEKIQGSDITKKIDPDNSNLVSTLDKMIKYYIYKESVQEDPLSNTIGEGGTRAVRNLLAMSSRASMSFHALSAAAGGINGLAQLNAMASKGKYIGGTKTLLEATKLATAGGDKGKALHQLFEELQVSHEDISYTDANKISTSKLRRVFNQDWAYVFQRKVDKGIEQTTFNAVMLTFGIDPKTNRIRPLDKLKDLYPDMEHKSLSDLHTKEGDDWVLTNPHTNQPVGKETIIDLKVKTSELAGRVKGQMSERDIAGYKTSIAGRMLMQYRSWIPATLLERVKGEGYSYTMEEYEIGRWIAAFRYAKTGALEAGLTFTKMLIPFTSSKPDLSKSDVMKELYSQFLKRNPENAIPGEAFVSFKDFVKEYEGNIAAIASELKVFYGILLSLLAAMFFLDDEEEDNIFVKGLMAVLNRSLLEIGFYLPFEPTGHGFQEMLKLVTKNPIPVLGTVSTVGSMLGNTTTETVDLFSGTDWDKTVFPRFAKDGGMEMTERKDNTPIGTYTSKLMGLGNIANITGIFSTSDDETLFDYVGWERQ